MADFGGREWGELTREEKNDAMKGYHFRMLTQSTEPIAMISAVRKSWHTDEIHDILDRNGVDCDKKLRIVVDYDPEFPLVDLTVYELA